MERHHYYLAGQVERGASYEWRDGYSRVVEGGTLYPWLTYREAQRQASSEGARAVFHFTREAADAARLKDSKPL